MKTVFLVLVVVGLVSGCRSRPEAIDPYSVRDWAPVAMIAGTQEASDKAGTILRRVGIPSYAEGSLGYALFVPADCQARAIRQLKQLYPYPSSSTRMKPHANKVPEETAGVPVCGCLSRLVRWGFSRRHSALCWVATL
jgi:hypothetical protein